MLTMANAELIKKGKMSTQWLQISFGLDGRKKGKKESRKGERKAGKEKDCQHRE